MIRNGQHRFGKNSGGDFTNVYKYLKDNAKKVEPGAFQWCPVTGQEAMGTH